jgi:hypothetical protein
MSQAQAQTVDDDDEDNYDEGPADEEKTYCDVPNPSNPCHDRKDYSDTTGLYTCIDGSHEEDWRVCSGGGAEDDDDSNDDDDSRDEEDEDTGGSNPYGEEAD